MEHMRRGEFDQAWRNSDILLRRHLAAPPAATDVPRHLQVIWNGAALHGKRVLVRCYHGLGDTIQFIRYIPLLKHVAERVVVWVRSEEHTSELQSQSNLVCRLLLEKKKKKKKKT